MATMVDYALQYLKLGFSVVPCIPPTEDEEGKDIKKPRITWSEFMKRRASSEEVISWFQKWPDSRIGFVTGAISDLFIVDCDSEEAHEKVETEYLPDGLLTPKAKSPHGYHYYFRNQPDLRNDTKIAGMGLDTRGEGGFIMAPPSGSLLNGVKYAWMEGLTPWKVKPAQLPSSLLTLIASSSSSLKSKSTSINIYTNTAQSVPHSVKNRINFEKGTRDESLFHVANHLVKGGMPQEEIHELLRLIGENICNPPFPQKELFEKIKSAIKREVIIEKTLAQEVREWVMTTTGNFLTTDVHKDLGLTTRDHKKNVIMILSRLVEQGIIEKYGNKRGCFRLIDRSFKEQTWWEDSGLPLPIKMPLEIDQFIKVFPGNIILLEGQKSQGKSAFALEFCRMNKGLFSSKILYQNVEMADSELLERFRAYGDVMSIEDWKQTATFIRQTGEWWDKILPDGLNVVDYLIEYSEPWKLPQYIFNIHQKLKSGIALLVVQRDPLKPYPTGGRGVRDIPRAIVSLIRHKVRLEDVKSYHQTDYGNPTGLCRAYKQVNWWNLRPESSWDHEEEEKYASFKK